MGDISRKRPREADATDVEAEFTSKRVQSTLLPFRESLYGKQCRGFASQCKRTVPKPLFTQTVTPAESDEEVSPTGQTLLAFDTITHHDALNSQPGLADPHNILGWNIASTRDIDHYDTDTMMISPKTSPLCLDFPRPLLIPDSGQADRLPTPIYGHFQQSISIDVDLATIQVSPESPEPRDQITTSESLSPFDKGVRILRLPTPISEDEAMDTFDGECDSLISPEISPMQLRQPHRLAQPLPHQSPRRAKPMFSMGFRADCDMCRMRTPGHYNHIFRP